MSRIAPLARGPKMTGEIREKIGIIDSLRTGFEQINKIIWILLFPIGLDLFLWRAPRVSASRLVDRLVDTYGELLDDYPGAAMEAQAQTVDQARQSLEMIQTIAREISLTSLLAVTVVDASIPSILPSQRAAATQVIEVESVLGLVGLLLVLQLVGLFLGCIYLGFVGQQIRDGTTNWPLLKGRVWLYWLSVVVFVVILLVAGVAIGVPVSILVLLLQIVAPGGASVVVLGLLGAFVQIAALWMFLYLYFLVDAIIISEVGPLRAIGRSVRTVAGNFWSTLGLIGLIIVISWGMQVIWTGLGVQPLGMGIAIVGNAYIASGLAAASMAFYWNRSTQMREQGAIARWRRR